MLKLIIDRIFSLCQPSKDDDSFNRWGGMWVNNNNFKVNY